MNERTEEEMRAILVLLGGWEEFKPRFPYPYWTTAWRHKSDPQLRYAGSFTWPTQAYIDIINNERAAHRNDWRGAGGHTTAGPWNPTLTTEYRPRLFGLRGAYRAALLLGETS